ncbi:MAG: hypothetical protein ACJ752_04210 [Gaiellaceae bacterium]
MRLSVLLSAALVAAAAAPALLSAGNMTTMRVSGPSPLRSCADGARNVFENAEVEPSLSVSRNGRHVIILYQQDRFADAAARGIVGAISSDGGRRWRQTILPAGFCATGRGQRTERTSDPWVSLGPEGRAYALASSTALTSIDGGRTWTSAHVLATRSNGMLPDKGSITADPGDAGVAYAVWARYRLESSGPPEQSDAMLAKTIDGGRTWSDPHTILAHGSDSGPIGSVIVADPRHNRLYHFACWQVGAVPTLDRPPHLLVQTSKDGGKNWSAPHRIAQALTTGLSSDPSTGRVIRSGAVVPSFALDRASGELYAAWQDSRFTSKRTDQIVLSYSHNGGTTWSPPRLISHRGRQAFIPTVAITPSGVVGIAYFESPSHRTSDRAPVRYQLAISRDRGRTFRRMPIGPAFSLRQAPLLSGIPQLAAPPGLFLGDYMGIDASAGRFHLAFVSANASTQNRTDVRYASVAP